MSGTRWVLVDDSDPSISYTGPWFENSDGFSGGNWGAPFGGVEHGMNKSASLAFAFTGTQLRVLGTSAVKNTSGVIDPSWSCNVDSVAFTPSAPWTSSINNWPLCESSTYVPGQHIFTLNASSTQNTNFWLDQIRYQPLANMSTSLSHPTVIVEQSDPSIQYISGNWQALTSSAMFTLQAGAVMTAQFTGTGLTWVGWVPSGYPTGASQASYSIDGGPAVIFAVPGLPSGSAALYNQHLFQTPTLQAGSHTLTVTYNGPSAPLAIDHLLVQSGDIILPNSSANNTSGGDGPNTSTASSNTHKTSGTPIGDIVGGAVAGVVLIFFALGIVLFLRWRKRKQAVSAAIGLKSPPTSGFPLPIAQVTPYGYGGGMHQTTGSMPSSSQANLNQTSPSVATWSTSTGQGGFIPVSARRDQKGRLHRAHPTSQGHQRLGSYPPPSSSYSDTATSDPFTLNAESHPSGHLVHHKDSGIRLAADPIPEPAEIIDVPPSYTAS